ncbi:hypothetical protein [Alloscardovia macacae]|uniref:Uncharacterized protein n=1 Tax=Alloscardovia macacae TaxID=1160091 RepID=A0A261F7H0_9BIFI|nr:hypothetical protein [Alloscardovia macacae]OZG54826.1 hypothetical protein ALMA_0151 [Alloscardovia macacae]
MTSASEITSLVVPSRPDELLDFLVLASTHVRTERDAALRQAWAEKYAEADKLSDIVFAHNVMDTDTLRHVNKVYAQCQARMRYRADARTFWSLTVLGWVLLALAVLMPLLVTGAGIAASADLVVSAWVLRPRQSAWYHYGVVALGAAALYIGLLFAGSLVGLLAAVVILVVLLWQGVRSVRGK